MYGEFWKQAALLVWGLLLHRSVTLDCGFLTILPLESTILLGLSILRGLNEGLMKLMKGDEAISNSK